MPAIYILYDPKSRVRTDQLPSDVHFAAIHVAELPTGSIKIEALACRLATLLLKQIAAD